MHHLRGFLAMLLFAALTSVVTATAVTAQDDAPTAMVAESDDLGRYLTDANGMTLYLFTADTEPGA
ncbi:MAG: hypothetical protein R2839_01770 [Thermomicrobiales bacterium]